MGDISDRSLCALARGFTMNENYYNTDPPSNKRERRVIEWANG